MLGLRDVQVALIRHAAPLHDVGKIGLRDSILLKPARLTAEEHEEMQTARRDRPLDPVRQRSPLLKMAEEIAWTHHERWDGKGYLSGMTGDEIPLSGRIVAVADVFDALTRKRPTRRPGRSKRPSPRSSPRAARTSTRWSWTRSGRSTRTDLLTSPVEESAAR